MITKFEKYNESIRDKMTPVSDEELNDIYYDIIQNTGTPLSKYSEKINPEFKKISDLFGVDKDYLYAITDGHSGMDELDEYFYSIIKDEDKKIKIKVKETETEYGGTWYCYPDVKIAHWVSSGFDEPEAWIFSKIYFENKN
jgi:hypothetical protein